MKKSLLKTLSITPNAQAKQAILDAALNTRRANKRKQSFFRTFTSTPAPALAALGLAVLFIGTLVAVNLLKTPLTTDQVIAGAISALDEEKNAGEWQYVKTKEELIFGDRTVVQYTESWSNISIQKPNFDITDTRLESIKESEIPNSSYKTTLEDGRVLHEYVTINGKSYQRDTREIYKEVMGYDPFAPFGESKDDGSMEKETAYLPPGFVEAGLDVDAFRTLSMKEIDDALIAVGQPPINAPMYKSLDFPAYTMKPAEIDAAFAANSSGEAGSESVNESLYGKDNYAEQPATAYLPDGTTITGDEARAYNEDQVSTYQSLDTLRIGSSLQDRIKALEKLRTKKDIKLLTDVTWEGRRAFGIEVTQAFGPGVSDFSQILYLDEKNFTIIGEEYTYATGSKAYTGIPEGMVPDRVKISYIERYNTNTEPSFSVDGLVPVEELYPFGG